MSWLCNKQTRCADVRVLHSRVTHHGCQCTSNCTCFRTDHCVIVLNQLRFRPPSSQAILAASTVSSATAKSTAGKLPKKFIPVVHERPATGPKSLLDRFPAVGRLSADDVSFLKALDRQFVKYGNVKIKVENSTAAASTPKSNGAGKKRTINSELG